MRLLIRCAVLEKDCEYDVDGTFSVRELKEHLMKHHTGAPKSSTQRIIYMGRILMDDEHLQQVIDKYGQSSMQPHVMHLLYTLPPSELRQRTKNKAPVVRQETRPERPITYNDMQMSNAYVQYIQQYQQAWVSQYNAYCQSIGQPMQPMQTPVINQTPTEQAVADNAAAENNADAVQVDDDLMPRDILDHIYMALRASILLVLLYYYSSTYRILAVACLAFTFWFMQRNQPEQITPANAQNGPNNGDTTQEDTVSSLQVFLRTSHAFIGGFFLSLLPGGDHLIEQQAVQPGDNQNQQLPVM